MIHLLIASLFISSCKKDSCKISFGNAIEYGSFTDERDGHTYRTVKIGDQVWFAENLQFIGENPHNNLNCTIYGQLYSWNKTKDACPAGWHLPTADEWNKLVKFLGGKEIAGGKMKEAGDRHWQSPNKGGDNTSGFTALPAGGFDFNSGGFRRGSYAIFWSSSQGEYDIVSHIELLHNSTKASIIERHPIDVCYSIRCVKD